MTLGERIKAHRKNVGMSQEKLAELVGISRQAVAKWEADKSAPSTDKLYRLAEIFGTTVDLLLNSEHGQGSSAEEVYALYKRERQRKADDFLDGAKRNALSALAVAGAYLVIYLIGRFIWCDLDESSFIGWLFFVRPSGEHSYLYGWLLSSGMFWWAMAVSAVPMLFGKLRFSVATLSGFALGMFAGILFGPYPEGEPLGHGDYGWAIWGGFFLLSVIVGVVAELVYKNRKKSNKTL